MQQTLLPLLLSLLLQMLPLLPLLLLLVVSGPRETVSLFLRVHHAMHTSAPFDIAQEWIDIVAGIMQCFASRDIHMQHIQLTRRACLPPPHLVRPCPSAGQSKQILEGDVPAPGLEHQPIQVSSPSDPMRSVGHRLVRKSAGKHRHRSPA